MKTPKASPNRFTKSERIAGAQLSDWPGDPTKFPIEKLGATTIAVIRQSLRDRRNAAGARGAYFCIGPE